MKDIRFFTILVFGLVVTCLPFSMEAQAQQDIYSYKKETVFPAKSFWNDAAVKSYRDTRLAITKKEPIKTNAVLNTVDTAKTALRGDGNVACEKKAEAMANVLSTSLILKDAKCSEADVVLNVGKKLAGQIDNSIQDSPDKSMVFDLRDGRNTAQNVSVDWDHGFFQMKFGDSEYSFRYEDGKVIGIAEVTRFRMLQVTEDKDGKPTADARAVKNAKQTAAEMQKNGRSRKAVAVEPVNDSTLKKASANLPIQCIAEPKPKYNIPASVQDPNSKSAVKEAPVAYSRYKIPTPTYTERSNPTCGYEASPILKSNPIYSQLEGVGNRLAKTFEYMRKVSFCSDSCAPKMVEYLSRLNPTGVAVPAKVEQILPSNKAVTK